MNEPRNEDCSVTEALPDVGGPKAGLEAAMCGTEEMDDYLYLHTGQEIIDEIKAMVQDAFDLGFKAAGGSIYPLNEDPSGQRREPMSPSPLDKIERLRRKLEEIHDITQDTTLGIECWQKIQNIAETAASALRT